MLRFAAICMDNKNPRQADTP